MPGADHWAEICRLHFADGAAIERIARGRGVPATGCGPRCGRTDHWPTNARRRGRWGMRSRWRCVGFFTPIRGCRPRRSPSGSAGAGGWRCCGTGSESWGRCSRRWTGPAKARICRESRPSSICGGRRSTPRSGVGTAGRLRVEVAVLGFARLMAARLIGTRETHAVLGVDWICLGDLGGLPRLAVWDGRGGVGRQRRKTFQLPQAFQAFRGTQGTGAFICEKGDPGGREAGRAGPPLYGDLVPARPDPRRPIGACSEPTSNPRSSQSQKPGQSSKP